MWPEGFVPRMVRNTGTPLRAQLELQIAAATRDGRLPPGSRLPSVRAAAADLQLNPGTVAAAYRALTSLGWLEVRRGSGYRVPERVTAVEVADVSEMPDQADALYALDDIEWMGGRQTDRGLSVVNLASSLPDEDRLTESDLRNAFQEVLDHRLKEALDYQEPMGYAPLRAMLSETLSQDGVETDPDCIRIISGAHQGLDIVSKALLQPGDTVLVEYPTYPGAVAVFRSRGARVVGVPLTAEGMDPDLLMAMMRRYKPRLLYVIPFYQNPTGVVYAPERLGAMIRIADAFGCHIVEDDYLRELRFDGKVPPPMKSQDDAGCVILVKSHSKLLMPGLRIGYMAVPQARSARLTLAKHTTDIFTSGLIQQGFHRFCTDGGWERHLERMRERLGERCRVTGALLRAALEEGQPLPEPTGGLSYWLTLPPGVDPESLYRAAGARGVRIVPDTLFLDEGLRCANRNDADGVRHDADGGRHVRISFASADIGELETGVAVFADCLQRLRQAAWRQVRWKD